MTTITWIFLTVVAALLASAWRILIKTKTRGSQDDLALTALLDFFAFCTSTLFVPVSGWKLPTSSALWGLLVISALFSAGADYLLVYSSRHADVADATIVVHFDSFYLLFAASIFLKEPLSTTKVLGVGAIACGSIVTLWKHGRLAFNKGVLAALLHGIFITGTVMIDKQISWQFSLPLYAAIFYLFSSLFLTFSMGSSRVSRIATEWKCQGRWLILIGALWSLVTIVVLLAFTHGEASRIIPFARISIIVTTLFSVIALEERQRVPQKLAGSVIVTAGALVLALH